MTLMHLFEFKYIDTDVYEQYFYCSQDGRSKSLEGSLQKNILLTQFMSSTPLGFYYYFWSSSLEDGAVPRIT